MIPAPAQPNQPSGRRRFSTSHAEPNKPMTTKPSKKTSTKKADKAPNLTPAVALKLVKGAPAEKSMKPQMPKAVKSKPTETSVAAEAMEYADKALAYAEFARKMRNKEKVDGGLVSVALEHAITEAAKDAADQFEPLPPDVLFAFMEQVSEGAHPFGAVYVATSKAMRDIQERVKGTARPPKLTARLGLILGAGSLAVAEKLAKKAIESTELHYYAEWGKQHVSVVDTKRDFKALDALADFLNTHGQDIKASQVRAEAEQAKSAADAPPEKTAEEKLTDAINRLSKTEAALVNMVKNAGGSVTTEVIKKGFGDGHWSIKDMSRLMDQKILSTPREGVVRLDESKLIPPAAPPADKAYGAGKQGPPRKSHAIKTPKEPRKHEWQKNSDGRLDCLQCKASSAEGDKGLIESACCPPKPPRVSGANKPIINPDGKCLCGCGADVKPTSRFGIGHDAKLHSLVIRAAKNPAELAVLQKGALTSATSQAYLKQAPWMTPEVLKAIGL